MAILFLTVFNWLVLFCTLELVTGFGKVARYHDYWCGTIAFLIVCGLALLFISPLGQILLRFIIGARKPIERESKRIMPIIEQVQSAIKSKLGLKPIAVRFVIIDSPMPDAMAVGSSTMGFSRGMYEVASDEELAGVVAHEMAHLHNGDSSRLGIGVGVSLVTLGVAFSATLAIGLLKVISNIIAGANKEAGPLIALVTMMFALFIWIFKLLVQGGDLMLFLATLFTGRRQEYRADRFAAKAGFGGGLLSFLEKIKDLHMTGKCGLMDKLYATHPPAMLRIGELEKVAG